MEQKFYSDNFEQFLKETTDNFRMYPSKRVWHGIYNDLHPSRKWPSLAVWLLLISSMIYIGVAHKDQAVLPTRQPVAVVNTGKALNNGSPIAQPTGKKQLAQSSPVKKQEIFHNFNNSSIADIDVPENIFTNTSTIANEISPVNSIIDFHKNLPTNTTDASNAVDLNGTIANKDITSNDPNKMLVSNSLIRVVSADDNELGADEAGKKNKTIDEKKNKIATTDKNNNAEKAWIEDFAFHNKPSSSKWKNRVTYQIYATPSIGYRILSRNSSYDPVAPSALVVASPGVPQDYEKELSHAAAVNMEAGANILYSISKRVNLKLGVQLNYTNYNINVYELRHPTMTTLMLNDLNNGLPILSPRSTTLANDADVYSKKLNNNSYQVSLPIGADVRLAGKNNLKWFAGATIQPTYVTGGNAYFISSDLKNYVTDPSLMRKWNLNAGVETFVSYKTQSGIILSAGPQFRYQLLSSYSKEYTYDEKLYNLGVKIGVITKF